MKKYLLLILFVVFFVNNIFPQTNLQDGLIGYYSFKGNVNDESGNNHDGKVFNASLTSDQKGNSNCAYSFNGLSSYIVFNDFNPNTVKTINFWIKPNSLLNPVIVFFSLKDPNSGSGFRLYKNNDKLIFDASNEQVNVQIDFPFMLIEKRYSMVTCKIGLDGIINLYLDSQLVASSSEKIPVMASSVPLFLGANYFKKYFYDGVIEDFRLYNRPLSDLEIKSLFSGNLLDGLYGKYSFEGNANDESGNNNNGTVFNASLVKDKKGYPNRAYSFNGESSYIEIKNINPNSIRTFNFWLRPNSLQNPLIVLLSLKDPSSNGGLAFYKANDMLIFDASDGQKTIQAECNSILEETKYTMITGEVGMDGFLHLYFNGKLKSSSAEKIPVLPNSAPLILGSNASTKDYFYNGNFENLALYKRPLTNIELYSLFIGNLNEGLIGKYPFKGNANDESGNNHHGKVYNATLVNNQKGVINSAYNFNGIDSYIEFSDINPNNVKTINFWIKPDSLQAPMIVFFSMKDPSTSNGLSLYKYNDKIIYEASNGSSTVQADVSLLYFWLKRNKYSMITCTIGNDGYLHLFLNGKQKAVSSEKGPLMANLVRLILGTNSNKKYFFAGTIEDFSLYNRPLLEDELIALLNESSVYNINYTINSNLIANNIKVTDISTVKNKQQVNINNTGNSNSVINNSVKTNITPVVDKPNLAGNVEQNKSQGKVIQVKSLPDLIIKNEHFIDINSNNIIDAGEANSISFEVENIGKGDALNVQVKGSLKSSLNGLTFNSVIDLGNIKPEETKDIAFPILASQTLSNGLAEFKIEVLEERGLDAFPLEMKIETESFQPSRVLITDSQFSTEDGGKIKLNYPISLKVIVQNIGKGSANDLNVNFSFVNDNCLMLSETENFNFTSLKKGESKQLEFLFTATRRYSIDQIPIKISLSENSNNYSRDTILKVLLDQNLVAKNQVVVQGVKTSESEIQLASLSSEVDKNIPVNDKQYPNRYALIIGNEDYSKYQRGLNTEMNVAFARNDASIFKEYAIKSMCVPESNILYLEDATIGEMSQKIELISKLVAKTGENSELIFYYAGHGLPDETTKIPYLIPVDISASNITSAIKLSEIYKKFAESGAKRVVVFLDACFSGGGRESGLLASRGVKVKPKEEILNGNFIVLTASSGEQSALPFKEKQHGIFTYFLLKKLQETKANITYGELAKYITKNVSLESLKVNQKEQDPSINVSFDAKNTWENWTVK